MNPFPACIPIVMPAVAGAVHIFMRRKYPPAIRTGIAPQPYTDDKLRPERRPSVKTVTIAPTDPGRRPLITRYPYPSVKRIINPPAVMESGPTPRVKGNPCIAIYGHLPIAIRVVGMKIIFCQGYLHIPVPVFINPIPIGR